MAPERLAEAHEELARVTLQRIPWPARGGLQNQDHCDGKECGVEAMLDTYRVAHRLREIRSAGQAVGSGTEPRPWTLGLWLDFLALLSIIGMLMAAWSMPCGVLE
jgi:hypothetical protein